MTISDKDLKRIKAYCFEATPGPWYAPKPGQRSPKNCGCHSDYPTWSPQHAADYEVWAKCNETEEWPAVIGGAFKEDAIFAAQARTDLPLLVAEVERLREKRTRCSGCSS